ncbi:MAG: hypothetical protein EOP04_02845 [Proteobacteria bacterium]|nr:MAG: hypothetical protein EOP04_02845 [Pseudomonadota bacterium]
MLHAAPGNDRNFNSTLNLRLDYCGVQVYSPCSSSFPMVGRDAIRSDEFYQYTTVSDGVSSTFDIRSLEIPDDCIVDIKAHHDAILATSIVLGQLSSHGIAIH